MPLTEGSKVFLGVFTVIMGYRYFHNHRSTRNRQENRSIHPDALYDYHFDEPATSSSSLLSATKDTIKEDVQQVARTVKAKGKEMLNTVPPSSSSSPSSLSTRTMSPSSSSSTILPATPEEIYLYHLMNDYPVHVIEPTSTGNNKDDDNDTVENIVDLTNQLKERIKQRVQLIREKRQDENNHHGNVIGDKGDYDDE